MLGGPVSALTAEASSPGTMGGPFLAWYDWWTRSLQPSWSWGQASVRPRQPLPMLGGPVSALAGFIGPGVWNFLTRDHHEAGRDEPGG